jgi:hypothetical protein
MRYFFEGSICYNYLLYEGYLLSFYEVRIVLIIEIVVYYSYR